MKSPESSHCSDKCETCKGTKKVLVYPDGSVSAYMPALAMDSHHRGVRVAECPECLNGE
jgi:hypothetical protein